MGGWSSGVLAGENAGRVRRGTALHAATTYRPGGMVSPVGNGGCGPPQPMFSRPNSFEFGLFCFNQLFSKTPIKSDTKRHLPTESAGSQAAEEHDDLIRAERRRRRGAAVRVPNRARNRGGT